MTDRCKILIRNNIMGVWMWINANVKGVSFMQSVLQESLVRVSLFVLFYTALLSLVLHYS